MDKKEKLEQEMAQILTESEIKNEDPQEAARKRLPHKQEVRIQTQTDPILEETKKFREIAEEVDDRYDKY